MSLNRYAKARDANEREIVQVLESFGLSVFRLDRPVDLLCGFGELTRIAEIKTPKNKKGEPKAYTEPQERFFKTWKGNRVSVLVTVEDARRFALKMRRDAFMAQASGFAA